MNTTFIKGLTTVALAKGADTAKESVDIGQTYKILAFIMFGIAAAILVFAVIWFFKNNVFKIIGDFTGKNARKSIAKKRSDNEKSGKKSFGPSPKAEERGALTDTMRESQKLARKSKSKQKAAQAKKSEMVGEATDVLPNRTGIGSEATDVLPNRMGNATTQSPMVGEATTVLQSEATTVLNRDMAPETEVLPSKLETIQNIVLIHTEEVI